ncbi:MAG: hypothetical protein AAB805_02090 [Patescibacteria group bacterium]
MLENDPLQQVEEVTRGINNYMQRRGRSVFGRYPLLFSLLATFGVVLVLHGFDRLVENIPFLNDRPVLLLLAGIIILSLTGTLYKRIEKRLD